MKKAIFRLVMLGIVAAAVWSGYRYIKQRPQKLSDIATAKVQRSDVVIRAYTRGELRAVRTFQLYAPNLNGTVQVTRLAPMGALAREKNLVVEYDDSELLAAIDADKLNVDTTDESIKSQKLQMQIQESKDKVELLSAQFAVERAKLQVQKNDVLDEITAKKNRLALEQAVQALSQTETNIEMRRQQNDSQMEVYNSNRLRSATQLRLDQQRLTQTKTLAPMTGLVAVKQNRAGNFNFGQQMPDVRVGDEVQPGMNIADLLDLSEMELFAKVGEMDRANLSEGQPITIQLDSIPDKRFPGKIKTLSGTATSDVFSGDPSKKFDVTFSVDMRTLLSGLGMSQSKVDEIMRTAEENAKKNLVSFAPAGGGRGGRGGGGPPGMGFGGGFGGFPGGGPPGMDLGDMAAIAARDQAAANRGRGGSGDDRQGRGQGDQSGQNGQARSGGGQGRGGFANLSDEDRQKMRDLRQQMQSATGDQAAKLQQQLSDLMQKAGIQGRGGFGGRNGQGAQGGQDAQGRGGFNRGQDMAGGGQGRQGRGGQGRGGQDQGGPGRPRQWVPTQEELDAAVLPPPPEQDSDVTELLRPGLLADVQIEVEKIPNALHVPSQAIFRKDGKPVVYVRGANGRFEPREVKLVKQGESLMVLASGVQEGEIVALSDPTASKSQKELKGDEKKSSSSTGLPGGIGK